MPTPSPAPPAPLLRRLSIGLATSAVVVTAGAHLWFLARDARLPRDLCLCLERVPGATRILSGESPAGVGEVLALFGESTGWWNVLQATILTLGGRDPHALQLLDVVAVTSVVGLAALVAARIAGPVAAACAALLAGAMPGLVVEGRLGWIHVPEAALGLLGLLAWQRDPDLRQKRTVALIGIAGMLAFALRPSGLVWAGSLGALLAFTALRRRAPEDAPAPKERVVAILAGWALASLVPLAMLPEYLSSKAAARARYAIVVPEIVPQLAVVLGPAPLAVVAFAVPLALFAILRRRPHGAPAAALALLAGWVAGAVGLGLLFRAGLDNHIAALPALAIVAAWAIANTLPRLGLLLATLAFVAQVAPQALPTPGPGDLWWRIPGSWRIQIAPAVLNYYVPFPFYGAKQVASLVDAVCPESGGCRIAAYEGLYLPHGEEPGQLELFLAGESRVELLSVRKLDPAHAPALDALVEFVCAEPDAAQELRWPEARGIRDSLVARDALSPAWATEVAPGCRVQWLTPAGRVRNSAALPPAGPGKPPPPRR